MRHVCWLSWMFGGPGALDPLIPLILTGTPGGALRRRCDIPPPRPPAAIRGAGRPAAAGKAATNGRGPEGVTRNAMID